MKKTVNVGIVGKGGIGNELIKRIEAGDLGKCCFRFIANSRGVRAVREGVATEAEMIVSTDIVNDSPLNFCDNVDIVFLAISNKDDGRDERDLIKGFTEKLIPVVTCAKGALGNYWYDLSPLLPKIGYNASVGGGSMMLPAVKNRLDQFTKGILVILNGTVNFFMDSVANGKPPAQIIAEAIKLGYAEPTKPGEEPGALGILNGEVTGDIPKKISVFCNHVLGIPVKAEDFSAEKLDQDDIKCIINGADVCRYFISFERENGSTFGYGDELDIGYFSNQIDGWKVYGGFRFISPQLRLLKVPGVTNVAVMDEGPYGYNVVARGLGAGPGPTVTTMIRDAKRLLSL